MTQNANDLTLVRTTREGPLARVTLDSPANRNALSIRLIAQLTAAIAAADADETVRVIVLDHTGPAFCAGADLTESAQARDGGPLPVSQMPELLATMVGSAKPIVAKVAGVVRAGGVGLVAAADIAVCADDVTFAISEVRVGAVPASISAVLLPRLAPRAAAELFLTGETFDARRAEAIGLVNAVVPADGLDSRVESYVDALRLGAPGAIAATKALLWRAPEEMRAHVRDLAAISAAHFLGEEAGEGMAAFREKRAPSWTT